MLAACKIVSGVHKGEKVNINEKNDNRFRKALIFYDQNKSKKPYKLLDEMYKTLNKDKLQKACEKFDEFIEQTINFKHVEKELSQKIITNKVNKIDFNVRLGAFIERKTKKYGDNFAFLPGFDHNHHDKAVSRKLSTTTINKKKDFLSGLKTINLETIDNDTNLEKFIEDFHDFIASDSNGMAWFKKNTTEREGKAFLKIKKDLLPKLKKIY